MQPSNGPPLREEPARRAYVASALQRAQYKRLGDGSIFGEIPGVQGVWANAATQEVCEQELAEVLDDWIDLRLGWGDSIPTIDGINLITR